MDIPPSRAPKTGLQAHLGIIYCFDVGGLNTQKFLCCMLSLAYVSFLFYSTVLHSGLGLSNGL